MPTEARVQHTPGPWQVNGDRWNHVVESEKHVVADTSGGDDAVDESYANAHLIAAAPDLLSGALGCLQHWERNQPVPVAQMANLRAAIAKARGDA